jgi:hypothetical protein
MLNRVRRPTCLLHLVLPKLPACQSFLAVARFCASAPEIKSQCSVVLFIATPAPALGAKSLTEKRKIRPGMSTPRSTDGENGTCA